MELMQLSQRLEIVAANISIATMILKISLNTILHTDYSV